MKTSLEKDFLDRIYTYLESFSSPFEEKNISRQPVHVVYGGADRFKSDISAKLGKIALKTLKEFAGNSSAFFNDALNVPITPESEKIYTRIINKLNKEPIEDFRIDFEDGFGIRSNEDEDRCAEYAAIETTKGISENSLPPFFGIRIKPLTNEFKERAIRTLDIYLSTLFLETNGVLPHNFVVTLPKISSPQQVLILVKIFKAFEQKYSLPEGSLRLEMMIETPQILVSKKGEWGFQSLIEASEGRCFAAHFGAYDFTSSLDISAKNQSLAHPLCDVVRNVMKISFAGTGIFLSDGATNILPIAKHKKDNLSDKEKEENRKLIFDAWRLSYKDINHSLHSGFYQGWDLHPAQIPIRYAANYSYFLNEYDNSLNRLKGFIDKATRVSLSGNIFDDAASAQGLLNFFLRGYNCGAFSEDEINQTGLTSEEIKTKSFIKILESRKEK